MNAILVLALIHYPITSLSHYILTPLSHCLPMDDVLDSNFHPDIKEEDFQFYKSFHQAENAQEYLSLLKENNIPYLIASAQVLLDEAIVGTGLMPKFVLKVLPQDFQKIAYLIEEALNHPDINLKDHYLNQLDDNELMNIFNYPDEWTVEDSIIAQRILEQRGKTISREEIRLLQKQRYEIIRMGKRVNPLVIGLYLLGVVLGLFVHFILVIAGLSMAYYYAYSKSVDPNGVKYFTFDEQTRQYGTYLMYASIVVVLLLGGYAYLK